ncbi:MAG: hypothetical protein HOH43_06490 [Candidatus Latescibacteria bacterium]|nr:hypothetical protein [Candidatus Latescibacterota bacterium]
MAYSIFHNATANLNRTIQQIGLSNDTIEFLRYPESLPTVSVLLHVNSDDIEVHWGYKERCDEYSLNRKRINTEKPRRKHLSMGGCQGGCASPTATGAWLKHKTIISTIGKIKDSTTVAAQESGDAVSIHAELFRGAGCRVVATSNFKGGDYVLPGLDIPSVRRFKHETRHVRADCCSDTTQNIVEHNAITVEELKALASTYSC